MSLSKQGFRKAQRLLEKLPDTTRRHLTEANEDNAKLIERTAKVLVPSGETGRAKAAIKRVPQPGGGQLLDFGPLSAILEGGTQERFHKTGKRAGKSTGEGPARPFVNPSMKATAKQRRQRSNKAVRDAAKEAKNNG